MNYKWYYKYILIKLFSIKFENSHESRPHEDHWEYGWLILVLVIFGYMEALRPIFPLISNNVNDDSK